MEEPFATYSFDKRNEARVAIKMRKYVDAINKMKSQTSMRDVDNTSFPSKNSSYKQEYAPKLINMYNMKTHIYNGHRKEASTAKYFQ